MFRGRVQKILVVLGLTFALGCWALLSDDMLSRLKQDYGEEAFRRGVLLQQLIIEIRTLSDLEKLSAVNDFFNTFTYEEDITQWQTQDYWATPEEFLGTQRGDCEDYVIAKYFALRDAGVHEDKLFLTYVRAINLNVAHMVLTYFERPDSIPLVLDNYDRRVLPATRRPDLLPVYSFNAKAFFLTDAKAGLAQKLPTGKIRNNKWDRLLNSLRGGIEP